MHTKKQLEPFATLSDPYGVRVLATTILDRDRLTPLVVATVASDTRAPRVPMERLTDAVTEAADVVLLADQRASELLSDALPDGLRVYGGAVRLYMPQLDPNGHVRDHPLFTTQRYQDGTATIRSVRNHLIRQGYIEAPATPQRHAPLPRTPQVTAPAPATTRHAAPHPVQVAAPAVDQTSAEQAAADAAAAEARIAALLADNAALRTKLASLEDQAAGLHRRAYATDFFTDPEEQLRYEIRHHWLLTYTPSDRDQHRLDDYALGETFLDSLDALQGVERHLIISACVDVLTRRAWEINGRHVHQMRAGERGAPTLVRDHDNAVGWRCNIQTGTPSARRLMWWDVPGKGIELAKVAVHDDFTMR